MNLLFDRIKQLLVIVIVGVLCVSCSSVPSITDNPWQIITLESDAIFSDLDFTSDNQHGWLVGTKDTIFETNDGGNTWQPKLIDLGDEKVSYTDVSFYGDEGWITGQPSVLLHTVNGGQTWERIPLSEKLPGLPYSIIALGNNTAEMVTTVGAIYKTTDGGQNWKGSKSEMVKIEVGKGTVVDL